MSISFTAQQRKDITRRQLNIVTENAAYATTIAQMTAQQTQLLNVDNANIAFYSSFTQQVAVYEAEAQAVGGIISATYTDGTISPFVAGDLSSSAQAPGSAEATFFPAGYTYFIPKGINAINGINNPTGTATQYESNIMSNAATPVGLQQLISYLLNGISGSGTASTSAAIPAGVVTGLTVTTSAIPTVTTGQVVYIGSGSTCGIYQITATSSSPPSITISSLVPTAVGISAAAAVTPSAAGYTESERETLTGPYQEILTNLAATITANMNTWKTSLNTQITNLTANSDSRSPYQSQNASALSNANSALTPVNTWLALPTTGVTGQFSNSGINPVSTAITSRTSQIAGRVAQIITALGSVTVTGNTFSGDTTSPYYNRYKWLDVRIDIASGSARRYFAAAQGLGFVGTLSANNTALGSDYSAYFVTKALTSNDGSDIIFVTDLVNLTVGDSITVVSETQPEMNLTILQLMGTTQIKVNSAVPISYTVKDQARIFKQI